MTLHPSELRSKGTEMDIEAMAREAGIQDPETYHGDPSWDSPWIANTDQLRRFAALVAEDVRPLFMELGAAVEAMRWLNNEIEQAGMPPNTDFWHQSIHEHRARIERAETAIRAKFKA